MTRRLSVEERRAEILDAATETFSSLPYSDVSAQLIARRCGVSQALVFHYFGSKAGLYTAFLAHTALDLGRLEQPGAPEEVARRGLGLYLEHIAAHPFVWAAGRRGGEEPVEAIYLRIERRDTAISALCEALGRSDERARIAVSGALGFVDAVALDWVDEGCPAERQGMLIDATVAAFLAAL